MPHRETGKPANLSKEDEKLLKTLMGSDFKNVILNHERILGLIDLVPVHYLFLFLVLFYAVSYFLKVEIIFLGFLSLVPTAVSFAISLRSVGIAEEGTFFYRIEGPYKTSYSSNLKDRSMIPKYRFWTKVVFTHVWFWISFITYASLGMY